MWKEWKTEWIKVRYRGIGLILLAFAGLLILWSIWALDKLSQKQLDDGYRILFLQIPLLDTVLLPTMTAMLASRLCDAEVKGGTLKLLCTLEKKGRLFDLKILTGACYLMVFTAVQVVLILVQGAVHGFTRPIDPGQILFFILQIWGVSLAILVLQVVLSFFFENQILPLATGIMGSFVGLFSWFFPNGIAKKCILWGYYSQLCFIINDWDQETQTATYRDAPFDVRSFCMLMGILGIGYLIGKRYFLRKEI